MLNKFGKREKSNTLDKFYTKSDVAERLIERVFEHYNPDDFDIVLEPSAGSGAFLLHLPADRRKGLDIQPDHIEIEKCDFFEWVPEPDTRYLVIGNPPFGRVSSLAIRFFEKSAEFADVIAFLIPRTFRKVSVQNKLDLNFHLVYDEELPVSPCCFEPKMAAKCCFQIWEKRSQKRQRIILPKKSKDWEFLSFGAKDSNGQPTPPADATFAIRAYGSNCGQIVTSNLQVLRPKSWHWIKCDNPATLTARFESLDYSLSKNTARQDSIGRSELVWLYNQKFAKSAITP
jgi:hypothetical protein